MAFFELNSVITIGDYRFTGVDDVVIRRGIHGYQETCVIKVPHVALIRKGRTGTPVERNSADLFQPEMKVKVELGYNGNMRTEFEGFVRRRDINIPLVVECEGYSYLLRKVSLDKKYKQTTVKQILLDMCAGTGIKVECPVDVPIRNWTIDGANGLKIIDELKRITERALTFFFIKPDTLWCGLVYTPYLAGSKVLSLPTVGYRIGWNTIRDNALVMQEPKEPVKVYINGKLASGELVRTESKEKTQARTVRYLLNNVPSEGSLESFAQEIQLKSNYKGWSGYLNAFLQPWIEPGYVIDLVDKKYAERNGMYLCESVETTFGTGGARRKVGVGIKLG